MARAEVTEVFCALPFGWRERVEITSPLGSLFAALVIPFLSSETSVSSVRGVLFSMVQSFCTALEGWITMCHSGISL